MEWVVARLQESGTWAGIGAIFASVAAAFPATAYYAGGVAAICGAVAAALKERGSPK